MEILYSTLKSHQKRLLKEGAECWICGSRRSLVIDHCHVSGLVRGILCTGCNMALGALGDRVDLLVRARKYVQGGGLMQMHFGRLKKV